MTSGEVAKSRIPEIKKFLYSKKRKKGDSAFREQRGGKR